MLVQMGEILTDLYGFVFEPERLHKVNRRLCEVTGSSLAGLHCIDVVRGWSSYPTIHGMKPEDYTPYAEVIGQENIWVQRQAHLLRPGYVGNCADFVTQAELKRSRFWNDALRYFGVSYSSGLTVSKDDHYIGAYFLNRAPSMGPYGAEEINVLRQLAPHFVNAFALRFQLRIHEQFEAALSLDTVQCPLWLCDQRGLVLRSNATADVAIAHGVWLTLRAGYLQAMHAGHLAEFADALTAVTQGDTVVRSMRWSHKQGAVWIKVRRVPTGDDPHGPNSPRAVVSLHAQALDRAGRVAEFATRYQLAPAELRLALAFVREQDLDSAARGLGISIGNARTTLKRVMSKTGTRGQVPLVLLVERCTRD